MLQEFRFIFQNLSNYVTKTDLPLMSAKSR